MFRHKPFIELSEVWDWFGYDSLELTQRAINRGIFPIHTYKLGSRVVIDKDAFDAFFLMKREESLEYLLNSIVKTRMQLKQVTALEKDIRWFAQRSTKKYIRKEFPIDLEPYPPQEWDPVSEFPIDLHPPEELKPEDIQLQGYYADDKKPPVLPRGQRGSR